MALKHLALRAAFTGKKQDAQTLEPQVFSIDRCKNTGRSAFFSCVPQYNQFLGLLSEKSETP